MKKLIKNYIHKLRTNIFFQNIAIIASGSVIARIIGLFTAPIITRLYLPEHYGVLSVYTAIVGLVGALASLRYNVTIPLPDKEEVADNLLKLSFLITVTFTFLISFVIFFFGDFLSVQFSIQHASQYLWVVPVAFFGAGLFQALSFWATRHKYFRLITKTNITQSVSSRAFKIGLGAIGFKPLGLLIGLIATQVAGSGSLFRKLLRERPSFFNKIRFGEIKSAAIRYKRFPLYQSWSQLLLSLGTHLPVMMIASIYGTKVVGLYGLAHGMVSMPMGLIGKAVSQVYYAEIAKYGKENPEKIYKLTLSIMKKLFYTAIIPTIILIIGGPWLFSFVFGENWFDAGLYARALSFIILFRLVSSPIMQCLNVLEKQKEQLYINIIRISLVLVIFFVAKIVEWKAVYAVVFYSISLSILYFFIILFVLNILKSTK